MKKWGALLLAFYMAAIAVGLVQIFRAPQKTSSGTWGSWRSPKPAIVVLSFNGMISGSGSSALGSRSPEGIAKRLKALSEREDVKAVVLRINSPGGSVGAVQEIYQEVIGLRKSGKKVVASLGDIAASGGYYIAAGADKIVADPGTLTGSIGVILQVGNVQELFKKIGVKIEAVKSAEHKDIGSPFRSMTDKEKQIFQSIIDDAYRQFVEAIVGGRKMDKEKVLALADGRIFSGAQAKSEGLIDELGNLQTAITKAEELAEIKEKPRIIYEEENPLGRILSAFSQGSAHVWSRPLSKMGVSFAYVWEYAIE